MLQNVVAGVQDAYGHPLNDITYDQAGNQVAVKAAIPAFSHTYSYNALSQLLKVDAGQTASYSYNGSDERSYKIVLGTGVWTNYVYFNGQPMAEQTADGTWSDYIYANGKKIARVDSARPVLHVRGRRDGGNPACGVEGPVNGVPAGIAGRVIASGDRLLLDIKQNIPTFGGLTLFAHRPDGSVDCLCDAADTATGMPTFWDSFSDGAWHHFSADLSSHQGETICYVESGIHNNMAATGTFDLQLANVVLAHPDGTFQPIFTGQPATVTNFDPQYNCGATNTTSGIEQTPLTDPTLATTYYLADQVGTAQVELSGNGVPIWQGQFTPFGQEIDTQSTSNHYKFTGKERDSESGLDYFGARYYASSMGRFMSPDPFLKSGKPWDPQSWNRYSYVRNNPLSRIDPTGLYDFDKSCGKTDGRCQRFNDSIKEATKLRDSLDKGSKEYKALDKALKALGTAGDGNGVKIGFGTTTKGGLLETDGMHIQVDYKKIDNLMDRQAAAGRAPDMDVEDAAGTSEESERMTPLAIGGGLVLGVVIGIISGMIGIGGGAFLIPAPIFFYGMSQKTAQGTSVATLLLPIGIFTFWTYYKAGHVDIKLALLIAIGFAVGGWFGALWAQHLSEVTWRRWLGRGGRIGASCSAAQARIAYAAA